MPARLSLEQIEETIITKRAVKAQNEPKEGQPRRKAVKESARLTADKNNNNISDRSGAGVGEHWLSELAWAQLGRSIGSYR